MDLTSPSAEAFFPLINSSAVSTHNSEALFISMQNHGGSRFFLTAEESFHFDLDLSNYTEEEIVDPNLATSQTEATTIIMEDLWNNRTHIECSNFFNWHIIFKYALLYFLNYFAFPCFLLCISCFLWELRFTLLRDKSCPLPLPGGRMGLPFIGEMVQFFLIGTKYQRDRAKEFGDVYRTHMFGKPTVIAIGEKNIKQLLLGEGQIVETSWPSTTRRILGENGIVNGNKQTHTTIKRLALRAFSPKYMGKYASVVQSGIQQHVQNWQGEIPVLEACKQMVSKTMMTVLLGIEPNDPDIQLYIRAADDIVNSIFSLPFNVPGFAFHKGLQAQQLVFKKLESNLLSKIKASDEELFDECENQFESILLNIIKIARREGTEIKLINLQNLSLEFIFAGTQSLQCASASMIVHLSQRPQIVERLRNEIRAHGLWDKPMDEIAFNEIEALQFGDCVVKETMRVTPSIPGGVRVAKKTFELGGYQVPRGWQLIYSIKLTHEATVGKILQNGPNCNYDPDAFFNCLKCKAEEHKRNNDERDAGSSTSTDEENGSNKNKATNNADHVCSKTAGDYSYVPFGKGSRMCAGKNYGLLFLRVLLFQLIRTTDIRLAGKLKFSAVPMTKPHESVHIEFTKLK